MTQTPVAAPAPLAVAPITYDTFSHSVNGKSVKVFAIKENWNHFVTDTADVPGATPSVSYPVRGQSVHRFPGDPQPFNRAGFTATRSLPVARKRSIPGKPFVLTDGIETRQFSFTGSLSSLYAYCLSAAKLDFTLISPSGAARVIKKNP